MDDLIVDGVVLPAPMVDGISETPEPIWSNNSGRAANCEFVGDIRAVKRTLTISWGPLTYEEMRLIRSAFTHLGKPFFSITYTTDEGVRRTARCYSRPPSSTIHSYCDTCGNIQGVTVEIVEC